MIRYARQLVRFSNDPGYSGTGTCCGDGWIEGDLGDNLVTALSEHLQPLKMLVDLG
jgi:hypothetical protein